MRYVPQILLLYHLITLIRPFSEQNYGFEIPEDASKGTLIGKIQLENDVSYRLSGHNQYATVDLQTGEISTSAPLDRETTAPNGTIILILTSEPASIVTVRINVLDINDNSPTFPSKYMNVSIVESAVIGSRIRLQSASDSDFAENGTIVSYELEDEKEIFTLVRSSNSTGGDVLLLELLAKLDRETKDLYVLNISARDGGSPPRYGHCTVYVNVLDANDNPPVFAQSRYVVKLSGTARPGAALLQVEATDADIGDNGRIKYRLTTNPSEQFRIDRDTGTITVQHDVLNCSKEGCLQNCTRVCVLAVEAEDQGKPTLIGRTLVYVHLAHTNSHDPELNFRTYPVGSEFASVSSETAADSTVAVLMAHDGDDGQNVQITITGGNNGNYFRLENGKNYGILRLNRLVDKPIEQFMLKFRATDDGVPPRSIERHLKIFVLNLNDTAPVLDAELIEVSVFENSPIGSFVAAVRATDLEHLHFSFVEDDGNAGHFTVGENTGIVTLSKAWPNHTKQQYEIGIMVQKAMPSNKFSICTIRITVIDVNNHKPQFSSALYEVDVPEDTPPLSVIFKVAAVDEDHGNSSAISYRISGPPRKQLFMIKENSGEVLLRSKLDRETQKQHRITVIATDHGNPSRSSSALLIVNVLDVNDNEPFFEQLEYHGYIVRGDPPGTPLVQMEAFDEDSPQFAKVSYILYQAAPSFLDLEHETGQMRLATHADLLDFERKVEVVVGAKDNGGRLSRNNATVHLWLVDSMQQVPQFSSSNNWFIEVNENSSPEKILATFSMNPAGRVRYRISNPDMLIGELTGDLRARRSFDREIEPSIAFTIYADGEWATATHRGVLTVLDQNDNSPQFELGTTAQFSIDSGKTGVGTELFRLQCQDPDDGSNARITYSINSTFFGIDPETGIVQLAKLPGGLNQLQFHVLAVDGGEQPRHSTIKVVVDIMEAEPVYSFSSTISLSVVENVPIGAIIASLAPKNTTQRFEFKTPEISESYPIRILPSGEVFVASGIDRELLQHMSIPITAHTLSSDSIPSKHEFILQLYIEDINDNAPQCPSNSKFYIPENNVPGATVGLFSATDEDNGLNGTVFYELMYDSSKLFSIDPNTGIIRALFVLDFEMTQFYNVAVLVTDGGLLKTECTVVIEVLDTNDNAPEWEQEFYHFNSSSEGADAFIGTVVARDLDFGVNAKVRYKLHQKWLPFKIDGSTGNITRNGSLMSGHVYNITVIATDHGTPPLSALAFVFVHTAARTECTPNFTSYPKVDIEIDSSSRGQMIAQVHAVACGTDVLYSFGHDEPSYRNPGNLGLFWIDSVDGSIILIKSLEAYVGQRIELIITAKTISASNSISFGVMVIKKNDESSNIDTTIHVQENNKPGTVCGHIETVKDLQLLRQIPPGKAFHLEGQDIICDEVLDREEFELYRLVVANSDDKGTKIITVQVDDENDNFPECFGTRAILVGSEPKLVPWNCHDHDAGVNGTIGYKIIRNAESVLEMNETGFIVNPFTGDLQHFSVLVYDRNTGTGFREDNDKLQKTNELQHILISMNPGLGVQIDSKDQYQIDRNSPPGTIFGTIVAKSGATVEYFTTGFANEQRLNSAQWADVVRRTGQLKVIRKPYGRLANMNITLLSEGFTKTITIKLLVAGEENNIVDLLPYYEFTITEGIPVGSTIGTIVDGGKLKFKLLKENDVYEINEKTGVIRTKNEVQISETYLDISVTGEGWKQLSKLITVLIIVTETHGSTLHWLRSPINLVVPENSSSGTIVGILRAKDPGGGTDETSIHYTLSGHPNEITIDGATGIIRTSAPFDYEKENLYHFKAGARGVQGSSAECDVFLYIIDRNDNEPKFSSDAYEIEVYEDAAVGQVILQLEVDDLDTDNEFVYEISTVGNERGWFGIKPDGRIFLTAPLDREHTAVHHLYITVYDRKPPEKAFKAATVVKVTVLDVNDNAPQFVLPSTFFLTKETAPSTIIGSVHAVDPDLDYGGQLQYRILPWSHPEGLFVINPILGYLQVHEQITAEEQTEYHLLVEATDYGIPRLSTTASVTVVVLPDNKHVPNLKKFHQATIPEDAPIGHIVSQMTTDAVPNALFEIESGDPGHHFQISSRMGILMVNRHLNADEVSRYNLTLSMRPSIDSGKQFSTVLIEVLNINDEIPRFPDGDRAVLHVGENTHGPYPVTIGTVRATDADPGPNGTLSYSLLQGNSTLFRIVPQTGEVQIMEPLDREVQDQYELIVQANDLGPLKRHSATITLTVLVMDVNDNAPVFEQFQYYVEVMENEPVVENSTLLCVAAIDKDSRELSMIRYSIADADLLPFSINSTTGCIQRLEVLDREYRSEWIMKVTAHDNGQFVERTGTAIVRIRVLDQNDNVPVIMNEQLDVFIRNGIRKGEVVYVLSAYDLDEADILYYSLTGPAAPYFYIDKKGIITAARELLMQDYSITAVVSDRGNLNTSVGLGFYVADAMRFPAIEKLSSREFTVTEHDPDRLVAKLIAQSANVSTRGILFSIVGGDPRNHFRLDAHTGELFTTIKVDYEYRKQYDLWIAAIDQHVQPMISYANCIVNVMDINDNKPTFEKVFYSASVAENGGGDELVAKVTAQDSDSGKNGEISYSLVEDVSDAWKYFRIDEKSGEIFTISGLDAEQSGEYRLHVIARDGGDPPLSETVVVKVQILDENDNAPRFSNLFHATVDENSPPGTPILQVTSYDADVNSTLVYGLEGTHADKFSIDQHTGWISLAKEVDREKESEFSIKVKAWDGLWEVRTSLTITVQDVNDNAPVFSESFYEFSVPSNSSTNTKIGPILATDADAGLNGQIDYTLRCGFESFMIEQSSGYILPAVPLEKYENSTIRCNATASDHGFPSASTDAIVHIHITGQKFKITKPNYEFALLPHVSPGTVIGHLPLFSASPSEAIAVVNDSRFAINRGGILLTNSILSDIVPSQQIILSITKSSISDPVNSIVSVEFTGTNMHKPHFSTNRYKFVVHENCNFQTQIGVVLAKDSDSGLNGRVIYRIIDNANDLPFTVDPRAGTILTTGLMDYEETSIYRFLITATDSGFLALNDTAEVVVEVLDKNDNVPEFAKHYVQYTILESTPLGATVTRFSAVDIDSAPNAVIVYHLLPDSAQQLPFAVNTTTGELYVSSRLHCDSTNEYSFLVLASNPQYGDLENPGDLASMTSGNNSHSNVLLVEIFVHPSGKFEPYFPKAEWNFKISAAALKDTIIGTVEAINLNGEHQSKTSYRMVANDFISVNGLTGDLFVKENWNGTTGSISVQVAATGPLSRNANFKSNFCKVHVELRDTVATPVLQPRYEFSLTEDSDASKSFTIFEQLPPGIQLDIVGSENGHAAHQQPFCIGDSGTIRVCGPVDREQAAQYHLQLALVQDDTIRSRSITTITVSDVNDNAPSLDTAASVGYILENSPPHTSIMKLYPMDEDLPRKQTSFKYKITDSIMSKVFAINESTGVLSTLEVLDREQRSLYVVSVTVNDLGIPPRPAVINLRIYVDDQDDNAPESGPRVVIFDHLHEIPEKVAFHAVPVDVDQVGVYGCRLHNTTKAYNMSRNCTLILAKSFLETDHLMDAPIIVEATNRHANVTYPVKLRFRRGAPLESLFEDSAVIAELWGVERSIADIVPAFEAMFSDMELQFLGLQQLAPDLFRLFIIIRKQHLTPMNKDDALKLLKQFFGEKMASLNVHLKQLATDMCTLSTEQCTYGTKCSQNITRNGESFELIGYRTSFVVPIIINRFNCICENGILCSNNNNNKICLENQECQNGGTCQPRTGKCMCSNGYTGKLCENDIDECEEQGICGNGKCLNVPGSFICTCDNSGGGNSSVHCRHSNDICNSCHRGKCVGAKNGHDSSCECDEGYSGLYCQLKIRSFDGFSSSMHFSLYHQITKLALEIRTLNPYGLLLSSVIMTGSERLHLMLALRSGQIHVITDSYGKKKELSMEEKVNDGGWKMIRFRYRRRTMKLTVENCDEDGFCEPCKSTRCIAVSNNFDTSAASQEQTVFIGGIQSSTNSGAAPDQDGTATFEGCMRRILVDDFEVSNNVHFSEHNIGNSCQDDGKTCADAGGIDLCSGGTCVMDENDKKCVCMDGFDALNCHKAMEPWHVSSGGVVFQLSAYMIQQIQLAKLNSSKKLSVRRHGRGLKGDNEKLLREIPCEESEIEGDIPDDIPAQWMELDFRTALRNAVIFTIVEESSFSKIELANGSAYMITKLPGAQSMEVHIASNLDDSKWHRLSMQISQDQKLVRIEIDGHGKEVRSEEQLPTLISSSLKFLSLGHEAVEDLIAFTGCFRRFIVNNQAQSFDALERNLLTQQIFKSIRHHGAQKGCDELLLHGTTMSLEWKTFWALVGLTCLLFLMALVSLVVWIARKRLCDDGDVGKQQKCWSMKFLKFFSTIKADSETRGDDNNSYGAVQRAVYCGPVVTQNNNNEVHHLRDSRDSFQPHHSCFDVMHDLDTNSTLQSTNSESSVIYHNPKLMLNHVKSRVAERAGPDLPDIRQLKAALRETRSTMYNPPQRHSSSECSTQEPDRRRRRRSQKKPPTRYHAADSSQEENSQSSNSTALCDSATYEKPFVHRPLHLLSTQNLESLAIGARRKDSSESESDSVIAAQIPRSLAPFRPPRTIFADSEESSIDGSLNIRENLHKLAQPPHYV